MVSEGSDTVWFQNGFRLIIFEPIFRNAGEELHRLFQERRLDNDMLQQGELRVMWCKQEGSSRVHLDREVRRVKRMNLFTPKTQKILNF